MNAQQTPLIDLLKNVPRTARLLVEENHSTTSIPVGKLCADAVEELERAQALARSLQEIIADKVAAEREACAKVAEDWWTEGFADEDTQGIAAEIRARGKQE